MLAVSSLGAINRNDASALLFLTPLAGGLLSPSDEREESVGPQTAAYDHAPNLVSNVKQPINALDVGRFFQENRRVEVTPNHTPSLPLAETTERFDDGLTPRQVNRVNISHLPVFDERLRSGVDPIRAVSAPSPLGTARPDFANDNDAPREAEAA